MSCSANVSFTATCRCDGPHDLRWTSATPAGLTAGGTGATITLTGAPTTPGTYNIAAACTGHGSDSSTLQVNQIQKTMVVSRHPNCAVAQNDATVSGWLTGATALMPDDDGAGDGGANDDVNVYVQWTWNNTPTNFATCTAATYNDINGEVEATYVLTNETTGTLLVVSSIDTWSGCSLRGGDRCLLDKGDANDRTFAHEFGHMAGLTPRNDDAKAIMYDAFSTTKNEFNGTEAAAVRAK